MIRLLHTFFAALALCVTSLAAAQSWPNKPVKLLVPFPPGGTTDQIARHVAPHLQKSLGVPVVVENRGGASGAIGANVVAKADPDGYTWLVAFDTHGVNPSLIPNMQFDTLKDLAPVMLIGTSPMLITAHPSTPYQSFTDVINEAKKKGVAYGTIGAGSLGHLAMTLIASELKIQFVHVPYKGGGPLVADAIGGHVPVQIGSAALLNPSVQAGRLRALAVTSPTRAPQLPNVPTIAEQGVPRFDAEAWWALMAPAKTPQVIITKMHTEMGNALRQPSVQEKLLAQGLTMKISSPDELDKFLTNEVSRWAKVVKENKIQLQN